MQHLEIYYFTAASSDGVEMKEQNTQTEIVQIKDQQMQAESTTQQQGIKTTSVHGCFVVHNILSVASINT